MIQKSSDDGFSSSSRSLIRTSASLQPDDTVAIESEIMISPRILKIVTETGFCATSESELKSEFVTEENIMCPVYRLVIRDARNVVGGGAYVYVVY